MYAGAARDCAGYAARRRADAEEGTGSRAQRQEVGFEIVPASHVPHRRSSATGHRPLGRAARYNFAVVMTTRYEITHVIEVRTTLDTRGRPHLRGAGFRLPQFAICPRAGTGSRAVSSATAPQRGRSATGFCPSRSSTLRCRCRRGGEDWWTSGRWPAGRRRPR